MKLFGTQFASGGKNVLLLMFSHLHPVTPSEHGISRPQVLTWARSIRTFQSWRPALRCPICIRTPRSPSLRLVRCASQGSTFNGSKMIKVGIFKTVTPVTIGWNQKSTVFLRVTDDDVHNFYIHNFYQLNITKRSSFLDITQFKSYKALFGATLLFLFRVPGLAWLHWRSGQTCCFVGRRCVDLHPGQCQCAGRSHGLQQGFRCPAVKDIGKNQGGVAMTSVGWSFLIVYWVLLRTLRMKLWTLATCWPLGLLLNSLRWRWRLMLCPACGLTRWKIHPGRTPALHTCHCGYRKRYSMLETTITSRGT